MEYISHIIYIYFKDKPHISTSIKFHCSFSVQRPKQILLNVSQQNPIQRSYEPVKYKGAPV